MINFLVTSDINDNGKVVNINRETIPALYQAEIVQLVANTFGSRTIRNLGTVVIYL